MGDAPGGPPSESLYPSGRRLDEQVLVTCGANALAAQILVVGHHGSMTSSRAAFLDAIGSSIAVVSSEPTQGTVTLPDPSIVTELQSRGQVFRTDIDDAACGQNLNKIGPDADGEPGGCTNIRIILKDMVTTQVGASAGSASLCAQIASRAHLFGAPLQARAHPTRSVRNNKPVIERPARGRHIRRSNRAIPCALTGLYDSLARD